MPRTTSLAAAGAALLVAVCGTIAASAVGTRTADGTPGTPDLVVHQAPAELELRQDGLVEVKAGPPARPGDTVLLRTAGTFNAGYNQVSETTLGDDLSATLRVHGREFLGTYSYWATLPATADHPDVSTPPFDITIVKPAAQRSPSCGGAAPRKADGSHWVCTYDDEFDGPELDRRYWVPQRTETSGFTTGTKFQYACAYDGPSTIDQHDGRLYLSLVDLGEKRDCGKNLSSRYVYGQVMHHQTYAQTYGRYEVRAKIPDLQVPGSQQSFWLWPETDTYGPWPASGELDFAEMYSNSPGMVRPYMHYLPGTTEAGSNKNTTTTICPIREGQFNTYAMDWEPGKVTIFVNGKVCMVNEYSSVVAGEGSPAPFDHPFFLSLNQAMGTIGNIYVPEDVPDVLTTEVDYVRVWR